MNAVTSYGLNMSAARMNMCVVLSRFSHVWLFATPWAVARQAPLSMGFSGQGFWSGLPCPPPGDLPNPGIEPRSPALQADSLLLMPFGKSSMKYYSEHKLMNTNSPLLFFFFSNLSLSKANSSVITFSFFLKRGAYVTWKLWIPCVCLII